MWEGLLAWLLLRHHTEHTNATFFRAATKQRRATDQRPATWHWLPGYQRLLWKLAAVAGPGGVLLLWIVYPIVLEVATVAAVFAASVFGMRFGLRWYDDRTHVREVVEPLHDALVCILGDDAPWHWQSWLKVPADYQDEATAGVTLELPAGRPFPADVKAAITEAVSQKLGVSDLQVQWKLAGDAPTVSFKPTPQAPRKVVWADVQAAIEAAPRSELIVGKAKYGKVVSLDLNDDSPHVLISAGSGGGKSVLARLLMAQFLAQGARIVILDKKRFSHQWAKGLPRVTYHNGKDIGEMHDALIALARIGEDRMDLADANGGEAMDFGGRIVLVFEEMNATIGKLTNYWTEIRTKTDPKRSPALEALSDLVNMGRQVEMHVVAIAQQMTANTLGGGSVRESFSVRCLSRYTVQTWKMLCADVWPMPRKSTIVGRWQIVTGGEATETQVAFLTAAEAQELAGSWEAREQAYRAEATARSDNSSQGVLVTLRDHFGDDYNRRRQQLRRDPAAPTPAARVEHGADLYRRVELIEWAEKRDAAQIDMEKKVSV